MTGEYPTKQELRKIAKWDYRDFAGLLKYVFELWSPYGIAKITRNKRYYYFITGGWSGNEDIIGAMRKNAMFWISCWVESNRNGFHKFEVKKIKE